MATGVSGRFAYGFRNELHFADEVTAFRSGIARQLSEIDGNYACWSTGQEQEAEGNEHHIEELSEYDEEPEEE
jgi:hypothetical protein